MKVSSNNIRIRQTAKEAEHNLGLSGVTEVTVRKLEQSTTAIIMQHVRDLSSSRGS